MPKRLFAVVVVLVLCSQLVSAQDVSRYRADALASSVDAVLVESGSRAADAAAARDKIRASNKAAFRP